MPNARMHHSYRTWPLLATILVAANLLLGGMGSLSPSTPIQSTTDRLTDSRLGRPVEITRLHTGAPVGTRPAILIVAGIDPRHARSAEVAAAVIERLTKDHAAALERADVYVIPRLNPDGYEAASAKRPDSARNPAKPGQLDADRDGRYNEDPLVDIDGDGQILWMRVKNPPPGSGLRAEYVAEEGDSRILRRSDPAKSERPLYALLPECRDADGDGLFGEDGLEGVEIDRNFPYHWPEFRDEAGRVPLSEPESRAVAEWANMHPELVAVLFFAPADNLVNIPPGGKMDETGSAPMTNHILDEDRAQWERIGAKFKDITHQKEAPTRDNEGTFQGWAYAQLGVWSFSTPVWVRPDQCPGAVPPPPASDAAAATPAEQKPAADPPKPRPEEKPKQDPPKPADPPSPKPIDSEDGKWITYSDAQTAAGKTAGFVAWKPYKHPQLGDIEIGGWKPGYRQSIPEADVSRLADEQAKFVADLLSRLPRLTVRGPRIERFGDTIWRISVEAVNEGEMPTRTNMGVRTRRLQPTRWSIAIDRPRLISGERTQKSDAIPGGGSLAASWTITGREGDTVKLTLKSPECGDRDIDITLEAAKEAKP